MVRVLIHRGTRNLGDAIQTYALCRILGVPCVGVYRDEAGVSEVAEIPLVANGWLGWAKIQPPGPVIFAGIHIARHEAFFVQWLRESAATIGARDSYTNGLLQANGVPSLMVGCATLTFDRYTGPRSGRYCVDLPPTPGLKFLSNTIGDLSWAEQWQAAEARLELLRRAELVVSNRLHVILPCLAFGTPIRVPLASLEAVEDKQRFTLLHELPFSYDEIVIADVSSHAARFCKFLESQIGPSQAARHVLMPLPIG